MCPTFATLFSLSCQNPPPQTHRSCSGGDPTECRQSWAPSTFREPGNNESYPAAEQKLTTLKHLSEARQSLTKSLGKGKEVRSVGPSLSPMQVLTRKSAHLTAPDFMTEKLRHTLFLLGLTELTPASHFAHLPPDARHGRAPSIATYSRNQSRVFGAKQATSSDHRVLTSGIKKPPGISPAVLKALRKEGQRKHILLFFLLPRIRLRRWSRDR